MHALIALNRLQKRLERFSAGTSTKMPKSLLGVTHDGFETAIFDAVPKTPSHRGIGFGFNWRIFHRFCVSSNRSVSVTGPAGSDDLFRHARNPR